MTRLVILESPYAGDVQTNLDYGRAAMRDALLRGESPMASHLLFTQPRVLDDTDPEERARGIAAGLAWGSAAAATVVYLDRGISAGMAEGIRRARAEGRPVEFRSLLKWAAPEPSGGIIWHCTGCGRLAMDPDADLKAIRESGHFSCCPERSVEPNSIETRL